jgi:hypothetical protein
MVVCSRAKVVNSPNYELLQNRGRILSNTVPRLPYISYYLWLNIVCFSHSLFLRSTSATRCAWLFFPALMLTVFKRLVKRIESLPFPYYKNFVIF